MSRLLGAVLLVLAAQPLSGQAACDSTRSPWTFLRQCLAKAVPQGDTVTLAKGLKEAVATLRNPYSLNPALTELEGITHTQRFIGALHLNFVSVQQGSDQGLALAYDWRRDLARSPHQQGSSHGGLHSALEARGHIAPSAEANSENFNEFIAHASFFVARGGTSRPELVRAHLAGLADSADAYRPAGGYFDSAPYRQLMAGVWDSLSTQVYFTGGIEARYESDQGGETTQWSPGIRLGLDVKAWNRHERAARFNIFDWPTALVRLVTGADSSFRPSGTAIPSLSVVLSRVAPGSNAVRDSLDDLNPFMRLAVELRWRTKLTAVEHGPVWLTAEIRHFLELDPAAAMSDAGLHRHARVHLQAETPGGLTFSWSKGKLPFTENDDDRWGLGFQLKYR